MSVGPVEKLHMVILMQPNLEAAIEFYKMLGIKLIFHIKDKWAEMKLAEIKLGLCPTSHTIDGNRTGIVLQVADIKKTYQELKDKVSFLSEPKEAIHGIMVSFKDPGGNILDLYQPTPERVAELVKKAAEEDDCDEQGAEKQSSGCAKGSSCCRAKADGIA